MIIAEKSFNFTYNEKAINFCVSKLLLFLESILAMQLLIDPYYNLLQTTAACQNPNPFLDPGPEWQRAAPGSPVPADSLPEADFDWQAQTGLLL